MNSIQVLGVATATIVAVTACAVVYSVGVHHGSRKSKAELHNHISRVDVSYRRGAILYAYFMDDQRELHYGEVKKSYTPEACESALTLVSRKDFNLCINDVTHYMSKAETDYNNRLKVQKAMLQFVINRCNSLMEED